MNRKSFAVCLLLLTLMPMTGRTGSAATAATRRSGSTATRISVYLVDVGGKGRRGKKIGCDDRLVAVSRSVRSTGSPLRAALNELVNLPQEYRQGRQQLLNRWGGRGLSLQSVLLRAGTATIRLTGRLAIGGVCDVPRISEQIKATARQFSSVKRVKVLIDGQSLEEVLSSR